MLTVFADPPAPAEPRAARKRPWRIPPKRHDRGHVDGFGRSPGPATPRNDAAAAGSYSSRRPRARPSRRRRIGRQVDPAAVDPLSAVPPLCNLRRSGSGNGSPLVTHPLHPPALIGSFLPTFLVHPAEAYLRRCKVNGGQVPVPPLCSSQRPRSPVRPASNRRLERPETAEQRRGTGTPSVARSCVAIVGCARFSRMNHIFFGSSD